MLFLLIIICLAQASRAQLTQYVYVSWLSTIVHIHRHIDINASYYPEYHNTPRIVLIMYIWHVYLS